MWSNSAFVFIFICLTLKVSSLAYRQRFNACMSLIEFLRRGENETFKVLEDKLMEINNYSNITMAEDQLLSMLHINCFDKITDDDFDSLYKTAKKNKPIEYKKYEHLYNIKEVSQIIKDSDHEKIKGYYERVLKMREESDMFEDNLKKKGNRGNVGILGKDIKSMSSKSKNLLGLGGILLVIFVFGILLYKLRSLGKKEKKDKKKKK